MKLFLCLLVSSVTWATTLTGTLNLPNATGATGKLVFSLAQQGALVSTGGCGGPATIVPTAQIMVTVTNGALIGSPTLYGNDCMNPQGTYYNVQFQDANANVLFTDRWQISGASIDIGTIVSVTIQGTTQTLGSTGVMLFNPTGNQIINQPGGTVTQTNFLTVTGTLIFPSGASCNAGGCSGLDTGNVTLSTAQNISGQKTFSSALLFAGSTDVGSSSFPATNGWFQSQVITNNLKLTEGTVGSPTDFFVFNIPSLHKLQLLDSSANVAAFYSDVGGYPGNWFLAGLVSSSNGFQLPFSTGDINCAGAVDGVLTLRTGVLPPVLEVCLSSTLHTLTFAN